MPGVTDVLVNGPRTVWVDRGRGLEPWDIDLGEDENVRRFAVRLVAVAGRRLDDASPFVDAILPGGVRLHAVLPRSVEGSAHTRACGCRGATRPTLDALTANGSLDARVADVLVGLVRHRAAFVVSGGTGTGKTTLLGAMLAHVPDVERIVLVQECASCSSPPARRAARRAPTERRRRG